MYARILLVASLLASYVAASGIPGLPKCASDCVGTNFGNCNRVNVECICSDHKLLTHLACCVSKTCDKADQDSTIQFANAICKGSGVTDLPQTATCASTGTGSSATATAPSTSGTSTSTSSGTSSASAAATSTQGGAATHEKVGGIGLGMVVAGLVAAI